MRRLRERGELTRAEAGYAIRASESKISRRELGRVEFKERDVADLLTTYGNTDARDMSSSQTWFGTPNAPANYS